ncbi:MAG TPA: peptide-methionine (S)-S-oxide reductase MsrA [Nannocystaceae bacterium]|nr:peptide-methionine (S)-S-oxide reductase MsrA [Nannocystaceae bacterium]
MMRTSAIVLATLLAACSTGSEGSSSATPSRTVVAAELQAGEAVAYFAGGCFWGVEHYMQQLDGVIAVESGYMGGHVDAPSYEQVSSQTSGHLETVRVRFDPTRVGYEEVAKRFFEIHDPTQADGQGPDIGPEYRSAIFYTDAEQQKVAQSLIDRLEQRGYDVVTELRTADRFWPAETYHQDYYERTGKTPYCHSRVRRFD